MDDEETKKNDFSENTNQSHSKSLILHPDKKLPESKDYESAKTKKTKKSKELDVSIKELKARLKKIKESVTDLPSKINVIKNIFPNNLYSKTRNVYIIILLYICVLKDESAHAKVVQQLRAYEALKEELNMAKVNITTEAEVLNTLFKKFQLYKEPMHTSTLLSIEIEIILDILNGFEYLIHQIDTARLFADMGG